MLNFLKWFKKPKTVEIITVKIKEKEKDAVLEWFQRTKNQYNGNNPQIPYIITKIYKNQK